MASLQNAMDALDRQRDAFDVKLPEIVDAIAGASPTQEEVDALAASIDEQTARVEAVQTGGVQPPLP